MDISVVICTYNRAHLLQRALKSLEGLLVPANATWEVVVVDNNSHDETKAVVYGAEKTGTLPLRYVFEVKQGQAYARNAGIRSARGDIVVFTDDDVIVESTWLCGLQDTFDQYECAAVGGKIVASWNVPSPPWLANSPYELLGVIVEFDMGEEPYRLAIAPFGANMAFRRSVFDRYGLFRTDLGRKGQQLMGFDDTEFCRRILRAGEAIMYAPGAVVYHPVERERLEKSYFLSWYFNYGRASALVDELGADTVYDFGIPRYTIRLAVERFIKWLLSVNRQRRFYYKLEVYRSLGELTQYLRLRNGESSSCEVTTGKRYL